MFASLTSQIGLAVMLMVGVTAILAGGWPERATGAVLTIAWVLSEALEDFNFTHKAQPVIFGIDCSLLIGFLALLVCTRRRWVVWACAYQGLMVLTHVAAALMPEVRRWDFFIAYYVWTYAVLVALVAGVVFEARPTEVLTSSAGRSRAAQDV